MRVIAGSAKGHRIQSVPGDSTRPITDRAKEALFSILNNWLPDARVLDLFAGTGGVGIEALSRGSAFAYFIDRNRKAVQTIQANLRYCRVAERARVDLGDSFALMRIYQGEPFDLIYIAPPQYQDLWRRALEEVDQMPHLLAPFGAVIVQIHREEGPLQLTMLEEYDRRLYGSVRFIFYARRADFAAQEKEELEESEEVE